MKNVTSMASDTSPFGTRPLVNNPVADSWQSRLPFPATSKAMEAVNHPALDLVGYTLNGRPLYRAWQLALLLGISPALLSTSFGSIPPNLRPFEIFDEDYESNAGSQVIQSNTASARDDSRLNDPSAITLEHLRRLAVLARTTDLSAIDPLPSEGWKELFDGFKEF